MILINSFSANMIAEFPVSVRFIETTAADARTALLCAAEDAGEADMIASAVGHADTAAVFATALGVPVECRRVNVTLNRGDVAVLGQYLGPRLDIGATTLPAGASIKWLFVEVCG